MFKYLWVFTFCACLGLLNLPVNAAPVVPYDNSANNSPALEWERDYKVGAADFESGKYSEAENALSSALVQAYEARKIDELSVGHVLKEGWQFYKAKIGQIADTLLDTNKNYNETKSDGALSDPRIDKTKHLLLECYKQHIALLRQTIAPMKFIPKESVGGLSIACGIIALSSLLVGSLFAIFGQAMLKANRKLILGSIFVEMIFFGLVYFALSALSTNLSDIDRLEKQASELSVR